MNPIIVTYMFMNIIYIGSSFAHNYYYVPIYYIFACCLFAGSGPALVDHFRRRRCVPAGVPITVAFSMTTDSGSDIRNLPLYYPECICGPS